jgi:hypothetical protein
LTNQNAQIDEIKNNITTIIIPEIGLIKANLTEINARLALINGTVVKISSDIGEIWSVVDDLQLKVTAINGTTVMMQTTLGTIQGEITSIKGSTATVQTDIGTIKTDISAFQQQQQAFNPPIYGTLIITILTLIAVTATLLIFKRQSKTKGSK